MQFVPTSVRPSPDGIQDAGHDGCAHYEGGDAERRNVENLPWVNIHAGILGDGPATALIWIMAAGR